MIEIHIIYASNLYKKRRGSLYHGRGDIKPTHFQNIMFVTHERNSHPLYEQIV